MSEGRRAGGGELGTCAHQPPGSPKTLTLALRLGLQRMRESREFPREGPARRDPSGDGTSGSLSGIRCH
ncbi:unnamed protein product [Rangifer tarandus platyrhynchus]|uniref:Uncharacterized protein n=2 Tax=Rangifer tarandus platyrhynchus TaxID=3082113 RepID=A0ACB0EVZ1_RANTA|nr:unnamed protein product [Rangifer tarandus platyrhynchus]CAI9704957.1 unnamed protein product [Rangifer tarandus platyrhynchus]